MKTLTRTLHPEIRIADAKNGLVEYVASDETLDSYREIIRAKGWRFDHFEKNAPFVDSHNYYTLENLVGKVVEFGVTRGKLVETVQWAIDVAENRLAQLGWRMTEAGYLKAVSVGFQPVKWVSAWQAQNPNDRPAWIEQLQELGLDETASVRTIYTEQQQIELSVCIIGANPNALAKAYKADVIKEDDLQFLAGEFERRANTTQPEPAPVTHESALVTWANARTAQAFLDQLDIAITKLK
jgi:hypothetical protein